MRLIASALSILFLSIGVHSQDVNPTPQAAQVFLHQLSWGQVPEVVIGYKVYRALNNAQWLMMAATTNQTYTFTNAQPGYYKYRITAYNVFGESLPSNEVSAGMLTPSSPTNLTLQVIIPINQ